MHVVQCPRCERYNNVPTGTINEVRTLKCVRCGTPLPVDQRYVDPGPPKIGAADVFMPALGLVFWPAGLAYTWQAFLRAPAAEKPKFKAGFAWVFMGAILHFALFFTCQPVHDFYVAFWAKLQSLH
ncbi:MAG: hypothetical protein COZ06_38995 [Armatimonadetes bacterium CG_4_10_14_3_um_filter_66_18]|nr:hypothetical protein [Armatimonadota bacterium]OIO96159.1 MAG: hypothetical protein AUJ96_25325 [Armatimonadetes bacterium CG2_30_66_41]PIU87873.1 MAG: hypothetical protein COS65_32490 [Armatimonadetes bacterium CG06_land_8_20_14_3_00_66_21]PIX45961.1 MAG: hypothetical protein COZ57_13965 [Armatimonadetes bacterium CG_4_8_14_3_um_filter_66_20]PIY35033.1 MAG: hypothetical protein COZ06_38995 [Armatimonadetes bacterium CG_4_10_14_3_um_filter_66_18]PIZ49972.1 MAG: hypothetical protein COY42_02